MVGSALAAAHFAARGTQPTGTRRAKDFAPATGFSANSLRNGTRLRRSCEETAKRHGGPVAGRGGRRAMAQAPGLPCQETASRARGNPVWFRDLPGQIQARPSPNDLRRRFSGGARRGPIRATVPVMPPICLVVAGSVRLTGHTTSSSVRRIPRRARVPLSARQARNETSPA